MQNDLNLNFEMMISKTLEHVFFDSPLIKEIKRDISVSSFSYQLKIIYIKIEHLYIKRLFCERIILFKKTFEKFFDLSLSEIFINEELIDFNLLSKMSQTNNPYVQGTTLNIDQINYRLASPTTQVSESIFIPNDIPKEDSQTFIDVKKKRVTLRFFNHKNDKVIVIPLNLNEIETRRYCWYTLLSLPTIILPVRFFNKFKKAKQSHQEFESELNSLKAANFYPLGEETEFFLERFHLLELFDDNKIST